jgi:hypothetical protein
MNRVLQALVHGKTVDVIDSLCVSGGREFVGRFSVPPTDGARASTP